MGVADQIKMSQAKRDSLEVAEEARQAKWDHPSFGADLFMGHINHSMIFPFPEQPEEDRKIGNEFLERFEKFLKENVDPDEIDRTGEIPPKVIKGLAELGCFGMKIPKKYGGLGLSQTNYARAAQLVASYCGSTAVWLTAHQSIGVPQPLKLFGTEEQKKKYLPRIAKGEISAFALTEPDAGSDPARMSTVAKLIGDHYVINGQKLWCTNGPVADVIVVMARTQDKMVRGRKKQQITAFIVETKTRGIKTEHRCSFMGLHGIQNGLLSFKDVKVPKENIIWEEGAGLKLALITLNTGRLTIPAACTGAAKRCLEIARRWCGTRSQWGNAIGEHDVNAGKLASLAATTFAMDAMVSFTISLSDQGNADLRLEAAMAKLFCSEASWKLIDDTLQMRGGRGYETANSLKARGEEPIPIERMMRDGRINTIIEGTSEIMRLFISREALDKHVRTALDCMDPKIPLGKRVRLAWGAARFYAVWYPQQWLPTLLTCRRIQDPRLRNHVRFTLRASKRLARMLFHSMAIYQQRLEKKQRLLFRFVDIGVDLFAMLVAISRAERMLKTNPSVQAPRDLADHFSREARERIQRNFRSVLKNNDSASYKIGRRVLSGRYRWLEAGIVQMNGRGEA
jgi:alkylation response protein AidB-like acyl-CoA dehydrogenase